MRASTEWIRGGGRDPRRRRLRRAAVADGGLRVADHACSLLAIAALVATLACGCRSRQSACDIAVAVFGGYDERSYCVSSQAECEAACATLRGRSDIGGCGWNEWGYCDDGPLPATIPSTLTACAIHLTTSCGGSASTTVQCHDCAVVRPGEREYDPRLNCTTEWGTQVARAPDCAQAIDELEGGSGSCPWLNDGECDEPEGTNLCPEGSDYHDCL